VLFVLNGGCRLHFSELCVVEVADFFEPGDGLCNWVELKAFAKFAAEFGRRVRSRLEQAQRRIEASTVHIFGHGRFDCRVGGRKVTSWRKFCAGMRRRRSSKSSSVRDGNAAGCSRARRWQSTASGW